MPANIPKILPRDSIYTKEVYTSKGKRKCFKEFWVVQVQREVKEGTTKYLLCKTCVEIEQIKNAIEIKFYHMKMQFKGILMLN